jgi:hypothetical protein
VPDLNSSVAHWSAAELPDSEDVTPDLRDADVTPDLRDADVTLDLRDADVTLDLRDGDVTLDLRDAEVTVDLRDADVTLDIRDHAELDLGRATARCEPPDESCAARVVPSWLSSSSYLLQARHHGTGGAVPALVQLASSGRLVPLCSLWQWSA